MTLQQKVAAPAQASDTVRARTLAQPLARKCACGARQRSDGPDCPECARKKLRARLVVGSSAAPEEREADRVADAVTAGRDVTATRAVTAAIRRSADASATASTGGAEVPAVVDAVLDQPGTALDPAARGFFEARFGRDFGDVRIHADGQAASAARSVAAEAFAVGNHLVFAGGRYAPASRAGRHLLAHELTHVVQQGPALRRSAETVEVRSETQEGEDRRKEEPLRMLRRHPAIVGLDEAGPNAQLTGGREETEWRLAERDRKLAECKKAAGPDPDVCDPVTPPDWSGFTAPAPTSSPWGAETASRIGTKDVPSQKCEEQVTGYASGPSKIFQGVFDPAKSWVKAMFRDAADPTKNGVAAEVARCEANFPPGTTGGWFRLTAPGGCAAAARPRGDKATKFGDCATLIAADFNDRAIAESNRLLRHEQTHFALTCAMAKKGNAEVKAGTKTFAEVDAVIHARLATTQGQYDTQTGHGCNGGQQAKWEAAIAKGLPDVKLFRR